MQIADAWTVNVLHLNHTKDTHEELMSDILRYVQWTFNSTMHVVRRFVIPTH